MEKTAYIVLGGDIDVPWLFGILSKKKKEDLLVGVDSGMEALDRLGLLPDVLLGDFDSISVPLPRGQKTQIVPFPRQKNFSDGELAVDFSYEKGFRRMHIFGGFGKRQDHFLSHLFLLARYHKKGAHLILLDPKNKIYIKERRAVIEKQKQWGRYISFFPLEGSIDHFSVTGVKYPLSDVTLNSFLQPTLTISNEITEEEAHLSWEKGLMLILETR